MIKLKLKFYYFMKYLSSCWILWQQHTSTKLEQGQKAEKVNGTKKKLLEEHASAD